MKQNFKVILELHMCASNIKELIVRTNTEENAKKLAINKIKRHDDRFVQVIRVEKI